MTDVAQCTAHPPLLQLTGIQRQFPNGTRALRGVTLAVNPGEVHGLVGANGAGKSTLIRIIAGADRPTAGEIRWEGQPVSWRSPRAARDRGLATIYQHVPLVPTLSVLENVFLDRGGWLRRPGDLPAAFDAICERVNYHLDSSAIVGDLPIGQRQMVCLFQALASGARLIVMDEPTASLAHAERQVVFDVVRRLSADGTAFLYVSHFLDEITDLTDVVTVLRDGQVVLSAQSSGLAEEDIARAVAGRQLFAVEHLAPTRADQDAPVLLDVRDLSTASGIRGLNLAVRQGEIVGVAGLLGSGRTELVRAIFGADKRSGTITLDGVEVAGNPKAAVAAGIALVPEDRTAQGLFPQMPIWKNVSITDLNAVSRYGIANEQRERDRSQRAIRDLGIVAHGADTVPGELSGGNAQKVVFAKWLYTDARLWLLDEPTAGVDVGAKAEILQLIRDFAGQGQAALVLSSEFEELLAVCTRIVVMRNGHLVAERDPRATDEEELIMLANGIDRGGQPQREQNGHV
ncbi:sugar ABC transporter ATP-binding protein [Streptomyces sp. NPDC020801]|uniref:sugar ABC transporter ATP-binding protein n=1 Tax=unclassified Streptomyces TaxID=2593676 RepID=UPI00378A81AD